MNTAVREWLLSRLGRSTPLGDLTARYQRLGTARAVAIEVVHERLADLRAQPATLSVTGVVNLSQAENIKAYERMLTALQAGEYPAPDDPATEDTTDADAMRVIRLVPRRRR